MFGLSLLEHKLRLPPHLLIIPLDEAIRMELENAFLDKVIPKLGLCISIYDIRKIDGGFVFAGEGAPTYKVIFRVIMFRPFVGEVIIGKLKDFNSDGLHLSVGFFDDIYVPASVLQPQYCFEPDPLDKTCNRWQWKFEEQILVIDGTDEVRFQVLSVTFPEIPLEQPKESKPFAPMVITGSLDAEGLGPVSWW